jgi:hypothetical protein
MAYADPIYEIPTRSLFREVGNPMREQPWGAPPFTAMDVRRFIKNGILDSRQWCSPGRKGLIDLDSEEFSNDNRYHISRVAYLTVNKSDHPIVLTIDMDFFCSPISIYDGNHRFSAALVRGDRTVQVSIDGYVDTFYRKFRSAKALRS